VQENVAPTAGGPSPSLLRVVFGSILAVACLFPPETRGESALGCAALLTLAALVLARRRGVRAADAWLILACVLAVPALLTAVSPGAAVEPLAVFLLALAAGSLAASCAPRIRAGEALGWVLVLVGTALSLLALYQALFGLDATAAAIEKSGAVLDGDLLLRRLRQGRPFGSFATPAALGGFLAMALPVGVGLAISRRGAARKGAAAFVVLACLALAASASATAAAALLAAVGLFAVARGRLGFRALLAFGLGSLVLGAVIVSLRGTRVVDPMDPEGPWRLRAGNLRVAAEMFRDHPATGVGPGGFAENFPAYRRSGDNETRHAHNLPLELLAETGLVSGALLSVLFFVLFAGPALRRRATRPPWVEGVGVGLAAFALHNLADFTAFLPSLLWTAAILRGALAEGDAACPSFPARALAWTRAGVVVLAGTALALGGIARDRRLEARSAALAGSHEQAAELAREASALAPWSVDGRLLYSRLLLDETAEREGADSRLALAVREVERAVWLSPVRPSARALRARARLRSGDTPGAYADLCEAARLYPIHGSYAQERDALALRLPDPRRAPAAP